MKYASTIQEYINFYNSGYSVTNITVGEEVKENLISHVEENKAKSNNILNIYASWLLEGQYIDKNLDEAVSIFKQLADQGDATAQNNLATCYYRGQGVEQDYKQAIYWYQKSAEQGYAKAQNILGICYDRGQGVEQSYEQAIYWYQKSAEQGYAKAQYNLGICYSGGQGVEQDYKQAVYWCQKSAEQGYAKAQYLLGYSHEIARSYEQAVYWYQKSAEQGYAKAYFSLGECHRRINNYNEALHNFEEAGKLGHTEAYKRLSDLYLQHNTNFRDKGKSLLYDYLYKGYTLGQAYKTVGFLYMSGSDLLYHYSRVSDDKRYEKAIDYFEKAKKNGEVSAEADLEIAKQKYEDAILGKNHFHVGKRKDIFISWNHQHKEVKDELVKHIEKDGYFTCWQSDRDCNGMIDDACKNAVLDSDLFIVIITGNSLESEYVKEEVEAFLNKIEGNKVLEKCIKPIILNVKKDKKGKNKFFDVVKEIDRIEAEECKKQKRSNSNDGGYITPFARIIKYGSSFPPKITKKDKLENDLKNQLDSTILSDIMEFIKEGLQMPKILKYQKQLIRSTNTFYGALQSTLVDKQISYSTRLDINVGYIEQTLVSSNQNICLKSEDILKISSPILLYGEGGIGKSLFIKRLIYNNFTKANFFFYLSCKNIMKYNAKAFSEILSILFEEQLGGTAKSLDCISTILNNEDNRDIFIVVDALDEISINDKTILFEMIKNFNNKYKEKIHFIFTSRNASDEVLISNSLNADVLSFTLKGITTEDIGIMFDNLLVGTTYGQNKEIFLNSLSSINEDIKRNPMLISNLIVIYFLTGNTPNRQYDILLKMVDIVFKNLEKDRDVQFDYHDYFNEEEMSRILEFIGYHRSLNNKISSQEILQKFYENNSMFKEELKHKTWLIAESVNKYLSDRAILVQGNINHQMYSDFFASSYCYHKAYRQDEDLQGFYLAYIEDNPMEINQLIQNIESYGEQWNSIILYFLLRLDYTCHEIGINHKSTLKLLKEAFKKCIRISQIKERLINLLQSKQLYNSMLLDAEVKSLKK